MLTLNYKSFITLVKSDKNVFTLFKIKEVEIKIL